MCNDTGYCRDLDVTLRHLQLDEVVDSAALMPAHAQSGAPKQLDLAPPS
jgi:hypothetical protein